MDGGRQVESVLQDLAGAGVDHGPLGKVVSRRGLLFRMRTSHFQKLAIDTYESRGVAGNPGDEDDLASIIGNRSVE
jgi:hypothetical protein